MNWLQLAYQYGIGGVFFAVTLALCFQSGASDRRNHSDRNTLWICLFGLIGYFAFHTAWIVIAAR